MKSIPLYINGEFCSSSEGNTFYSSDSATGESIAKVELPSKSDIEKAISSAKKAFYSKDWRKITPSQRADYLEKIADGIKAKFNEFVEWEMRDSGSILKKATLDIKSCIASLRNQAKILRNFQFESINSAISDETKTHLKIKEPVGVCALITPWNYPLKMVIRKIIPAFSAGCTSILKTAKETPITAIMLAEIIDDLSLPPGVFNIITGGEEEGRYLLNHPDIRKISFTGSTAVGKEIMRNAASKMQRVTLELGGKSASIVLPDADLDICVDGLLHGFLFHSGQSCTSGTRIFIHEKIYGELVPLLVQRMEAIKVGSPTETSTGLGPVINETQFLRIINFINEAKNQGAKILTGGQRVTGGEFDKGFYIQPTLFEMNPEHTIYQEEIFGPVAGVMIYSDINKAIQLANDSRYGLAASVWTQDQETAHEIARRLEAGTVWINEYHMLNDFMPFGGYKESGLGREMGEEGLNSFLEAKHIAQSMKKRPQRYYPSWDQI